MSTISSAPAIATYPPLPPPVAGIDINFCKNPRCRNFGVPAEIVSHRRLAGTPLISTPGKAYKRFSRAKMRPKLECLLCGEASTRLSAAPPRGRRGGDAATAARRSP